MGRQLWTRIDEPGDSNDLAVAPDGEMVYVTGCNSMCDGGKMQTAAYSIQSGQQVWVARFEGTKQSYAAAVTVSPDGSKVFVTGYARYTFNDFGDYETIAYDAATGTQLWTARYSVDTNDFGCCVNVSPDGTKVFVTGESWTDATAFDYATIAYDAATGVQLWVARYNGPINGYDDPTALGVSPDSTSVFVTGGSPGRDRRNDYATIAYDAATGTQRWVARYNNLIKDGDTPYDLAVSPDGGRLFVTGCKGTLDECYSSDYLTIAYDVATGSRLWLATYNGPVDGDDFALSAGVSPDGSLLYVTGSSEQRAGTDYLTIAYDARTGTQRWLSTFSGGPAGEPGYDCCLAVSADGSRLIVTGEIGTAYYGVDGFVTVAYDPRTGSPLWSQRFTGQPSYNITSAVGVTPNGEVAIVTGTTIGPDGSYRFATVAYRA